MTFTVTDALMSPLGLAVLTGAGFAGEADLKHVHCTYDLALDGTTGKGEITLEALAAELGLPASTEKILFCNDAKLKPYATVLDGNGAIVDWVDAADITIAGGTPSQSQEAIIEITTGKALTVTAAKQKGKTIKLDFYVAMTTGATQIRIGADDFGGYFYVEADTLYRNQDGKDMAATITFPKVKIQSGFTLTMAANGDPSTFDFVMDAFPAYTYFDHTEKVCCDITIVSGEGAADTGVAHTLPADHKKNGISG